VSARPSAPVLVLEHDPDIRAAITALLETMGFQTVGVGDAASAHRFLARRVPCMIVADVVADGWDLGSARARDERLARVPVIGLLPSGDGADVAVTLGVVGAARKPLDFDELERLLERHCPA